MNLQHLSHKTLLTETSLYVSQEREILSKLLWHLKEVDRRKLYSELKYKSLFDYCVKNLKYSESQAARRVNACRLLGALPDLEKPISSGAINLTQLNQASQFFKDENITDNEQKLDILGQIEGKSTRETDKMLNDLKKDETPRKVWITLNEETKDRIHDVKGMKAHVNNDIDSFLMTAMNEVEELWTPKNVRGTQTTSSTRYIPTHVKAQVWRRDQGKCVNCGSKHAVQFDHIKAFSLGGQTNAENLRLLCRNCNQRSGISQFGQRRVIITP